MTTTTTATTATKSTTTTTTATAVVSTTPTSSTQACFVHACCDHSTHLSVSSAPILLYLFCLYEFLLDRQRRSKMKTWRKMNVHNHLHTPIHISALVVHSNLEVRRFHCKWIRLLETVVDAFHDPIHPVCTFYSFPYSTWSFSLFLTRLRFCLFIFVVCSDGSVVGSSLCLCIHVYACVECMAQIYIYTTRSIDRIQILIIITWNKFKGDRRIKLLLFHWNYNGQMEKGSPTCFYFQYSADDHEAILYI